MKEKYINLFTDLGFKKAFDDEASATRNDVVHHVQLKDQHNQTLSQKALLNHSKTGLFAIWQIKGLAASL
ncbi:MAG: hypothetical protein CMI12_10850 [Oceanospirillum sp.]|nr:hypothetical protein [Oceanospirillum sp.]